MRTSPFSIINCYTGRVKLVTRKNRTLGLFPFRNLSLPCSSFSESEDFSPEDSTTFSLKNLSLPCSSFSESEDFSPEDSTTFPLKNLEFVLSKPVKHSVFSLGEKEIDTFASSESLISETPIKKHKGIEKIKSILVNRGWNLRCDNGLRIEIDELNVVRILNDVFDESSDAALTFYFFRWCENCAGSRHSIRSVCTMTHILVSGNMSHRAVDLLLYLVRNNNEREEWHQFMFNVLKDTSRNRRVLQTLYSMLVDAYVRENMISMALKLVNQMKTLIMFPSTGVCNSLLKKLLESKQIELACEMLEEMHSKGMVNASIISLFIHQYCVDGSIESASKLLLEMGNYGFKPDGVAYTIVIDALCKMGLLEEATAILFKMIQMGIPPDSVSVTSVVDGFCNARRLDEASNIWKVSGCPPNVFVYNSFISLFCREGNMIEATKFLHEMSELGINPDCCSYTTVIGGYCKGGNLDKALKYLGEMLKRGFSPAIVTYTVIMDQYCKNGDLEMAENLFRMMIVEGLKPDVVTYNTLMNGYKKKCLVNKVYKLLDMMRHAHVAPDAATFNIVIHALALRGFVKESRTLLEELKRRGFSPDVAYTNIIHGLSKEGSFEEAFLVWSYMSEDGMRPDVVTCSALLYGYCKARRMEEANALFRKMLDAGLNPDLILYNTLINGFCSNGNISDACQLVSMMAERGVIPNHVTYKAFVHAFEKNSIEHPAENAAIKLYQILSKHGISVDISEYM